MPALFDAATLAGDRETGDDQGATWHGRIGWLAHLGALAAKPAGAAPSCATTFGATPFGT